MAEHELEKLLGGFAADTLTPEERRQLFTAAMQDQQLFNALADEQALKELLSDPEVRRRLLHILNNTASQSDDKPVSWLDWFRRPANLALAGGLATAVFAVVLGTKIYQESLKTSALSSATESAAPATTPVPPPSTEPASTPKETEPTGPASAKKERLSDKPVTKEQTLDKTRQEVASTHAESPIGQPTISSESVVAPTERQRADSSPAAAPEPMILQAPAKSSSAAASAQSIGARALFYGDGIPTDAGSDHQDHERAMDAPAEPQTPPAPFTRKLENFSQLSKAAAPATPDRPLGLRYSFVIANADGQEQEVDAATAAANSAPVQLTLEANQDSYIQVWGNVGSPGTHLLLPQKDSGHMSQKMQARQRQRLVLPAERGTVIVRLSRVPFGPISRQEAALLNRQSPHLLQESAARSSQTGTQEQATYVVSQDPAPTAHIAIDILPARQQ